MVSRFDFLAVVLVSVVLMRCGHEPDVILGNQPVNTILRGTVTPCPSPTTVFLIGAEDGDTIAVTEASVPDGEFVFKEVNYDYYTVLAVREGWCAQDNIRFWDPIASVQLYRDMPPDFARIQIPISPEQLIHDTLLWLRLDHRDYEIIYESVDVAPSSLHRNTEIRQETSNGAIRLFMDIDTVFALDTFRLSFQYKSMLSCDLGTVYSLHLAIPVDSAGLDSAITALQVESLGSFSVNSEFFRSQSRAPDTVTMGPEDHLGIVFASAVDQVAVGDAIRTVPPIAADYFWSGDTLRIIPANRLITDTTYHVTIDPQVRPFRAPLEFTIRTWGDRSSFFRRYWPIDHTLEVPLNLPFEFESHYSLEPELLENAFTIEPSVDSLRFVSSAPGAVKVYHAPLEQETTYRISIDKNCRSRKGTVLGESVTIEFTTESDL